MQTQPTALFIALLASACSLSSTPPDASEVDDGQDVFVDDELGTVVDARSVVVMDAGTEDAVVEDGGSAFCSSHDTCATGRCMAGVCVEQDPAECAAEGEDCGLGPDCCGGSECRFTSYGIATCVVPLADGSECVYSAECASRQCADGLCRALECRDEAERCDVDQECCRGVCAGGASDGAYGWGSCALPLVAGSACLRDAWCGSRSCVDGLCE